MQANAWHRIDTEEVLQHLESSAEGLTTVDAQREMATPGGLVLATKKLMLNHAAACLSALLPKPDLYSFRQ